MSNDHSEAAFNTAVARMPWGAVPFGDQERIAALQLHFGLLPLPSLVRESCVSNYAWYKTMRCMEFICCLYGYCNTTQRVIIIVYCR